jgi:hypothetical protein
MADKQRRQTHQIATVNPKDRVNFDVLSATRFTLQQEANQAHAKKIHPACTEWIF